MELTDYKALTFDVYGTLIDWESGMIQGLKPLIHRLDQEPPRNAILQAHARHESFQQRYTPTKPYQDILPVVYRRLAEEWGLSVGWDECLDYGQSVKNWPAFADSVDALHYLKAHFKLVVLSNVDNNSFVYSNAKLQVEFDAVYTAEDIGSYKPSRRNFEYMLDELGTIGIAKEQVLHTAESMFHDHEPANQFGLAGCHIYRRHNAKGFGATMTPKKMPSVDFRFNSMAELVTVHQEALLS